VFSDHINRNPPSHLRVVPVGSDNRVANDPKVEADLVVQAGVISIAVVARGERGVARAVSLSGPEY